MSDDVATSGTDQTTFRTQSLGKALFLILAGYEPTHASVEADGKFTFRFSHDAAPYSRVYSQFNDAVFHARDMGQPLNASQLYDKADEVWSEMETAYGGQRM